MSAISITLNGTLTDLPEGATIPDVLRYLRRAPEAPGVAVAVNDSVVRRTDWDSTTLDDGDRVEVITASQGG